MTLEALRRDARPRHAAKPNSLGEPGIVTIEQSGGIRMQRMDLKKTRSGHSAGASVVDFGVVSSRR
jgi:hypothetical protein